MVTYAIEIIAELLHGRYVIETQTWPGRRYHGPSSYPGPFQTFSLGH